MSFDLGDTGFGKWLYRMFDRNRKTLTIGMVVLGIIASALTILVILL